MTVITLLIFFICFFYDVDLLTTM